MIFLPNFQNMQICSAFAIFAIIMKIMISLSLRSRLLRQFSGATTPPGLRGGGAKCFQACRVEMDHPSGRHDAGGDGGDDDDGGGDGDDDGGDADDVGGGGE